MGAVQRVPFNPSGLCQCGCGQRTNPARDDDSKRGIVKGEPLRYLRGHQSRVDAVSKLGPARKAKAEREETVLRPRRERVAAMYRAGYGFAAIAGEVGTSPDVVRADVKLLRAAGEDLPYRKVPMQTYLTTAIEDEIIALWGSGLTAKAIGARLGWIGKRAETVTARLRRDGRLTPRAGMLGAVGPTERRRIRREYRKIQPAAGLHDSHKAVLRVVQVAKRPITTAEVRVLSAAVGFPSTRNVFNAALRRLEDGGFIDRAPAADEQWADRKWRWFVPLKMERRAEVLSLADAERETELARLIEEQDLEEQRGEWVDVDWKTTSIDREIGEGGTLHDLIEDVAA